MNPAFDIDALRAIVTGNDLGSFAQAAIHLGRSQSAISMQLKKTRTSNRSATFHS
ncbi:LysR family transcriptional regulator [Thalassospira sp. MCCC 1A01428]|uniref:LysR family transcriptional regulator n=1 Tax=Thalassospira sp. MCCC 1A01428 TaxID=1470575 RepID=UPI001AEFA9A5